jgi:multidrug resistance efflux pump
VRLAQRIPVRIAFDDVPADFRLIAGRTATVSIMDDQPKSGDRAMKPFNCWRP